MKKIFALLVVCLSLWSQQSLAQTQQLSNVEKAEIKGIENEFYKTNEAKLGIRIRNPFSYNVVAEVELHAKCPIVTADRSDLRFDPTADLICLKKYIVMGPNEEYNIPTPISVEGLNENYAVSNYPLYDGPYFPAFLYVEIKAYKASFFQQ